MVVVVAGATGLLGRALCGELLRSGHQVIALVRSPQAAKDTLGDSVRVVPWEVNVAGEWERVVGEADAVINLTGAPIAGRRWTSDYKQVLRSSRVDTTHALVRAWADSGSTGGVLLNASAVGYYGDCGEAPVTEECRRGDGFLAELCADWEAEALKACQFQARVVVLRTGIVLSTDGGMLPRLVAPFRWFAGGTPGNGAQWVPWIHVEDHVRMVLWALENGNISGPLNVCAPHPVRMRDLVAAVARILRRPAVLRVPAFVLSLAFGEMGRALLVSQRVVPDVASRNGFEWRYPRIEGALRSLLGPRRPACPRTTGAVP